ncbi:MAG: thioredoxin domain-containing protein [Bacteroidales bacterium]
MEGNSHKTNHLTGQTSPYLLQHLYNPVDWYPWGEEALDKAVREDKPILVSIGYSACHWCHVMERESFEDQEIADIMNTGFVCIKVDREERPDIDHMYMTAVQLLTRQGGWPLNCFALPDTRPFWGGTYFRKDQWKNILVQIAELYKTRKNDLSEQAEQLTQGISAANFIQPSNTQESFDESDATAVYSNVMEYMDREEGGTLRAPKFPLPVNMEFLLHYNYHSGDKNALNQVDLSLEKMAMGGIYDQIGSGFARYSTDDIWKVPHFEKMLYDNGQLLSLYSNAWKVLKKPLYKDVVCRTVEFIERELTSPQGTFYAALDADSEGEEGKFYVWKEKEIDEICGKDASLIKDYYQVGKKGYWENGKNILLRDENDEDFASARGLTAGELREITIRANKQLLDERGKRERPGLDNKVITSWNALMICGLADAYAAFGDRAFLEKAKHAADFISDNAVSPEGKIFRTLQGNKPFIDGFLEDYALLIRALIRLYEVSYETKYLTEAKHLAEYVTVNFSADDTSLFSFSSTRGEKLKAPFYELPDNVIPSSNSVMALNLFYLSGYFEEPAWYDRSSQMLGDIKQQLTRQSINYSNWARLMLHKTYDYYTLVITGPDAAEHAREVNSMFLPALKLAVSSCQDNTDIPIFRERCREDETWFYVCSMGRCNLPVKKLALALEQIR